MTLPEPLRALAGDPLRAGLVLDVDGTLAPIVDRARDARVPDETRAELRRLAGRYGLVACVSDRPGPDAARVVGVPEVAIVAEQELQPEEAAWVDRLAEFARGVDWPAERRRLSLAFHYRRADDEAAARAYLTRVAAWAAEQGLVPRWGRLVLEVRPPLEVDKGTAVRRLLADYGLSRALYAGDDAEDVEAFRGLDGLELGVRVAVASDGGPEELRAAADLVVDDPEALLTLLRLL